MFNWQLNVLGTASLTGEGKTLHLERKTVGLLCYLALEGPTPRSKIAGLLWPESGENTARSNLRQLLSRLKKSTGVELVIATDLLRLQGLEVDAAKLKVLAFSNSDEALQLIGELLAPHDYDDCPDFADWLFAERERIGGLQHQALTHKVKMLEQAANYSEALRHAESLLSLAPLSEETHRHIMCLHYLLGDRAAALAAFERCKTILQKELGVEPLAETLALVSEIEFGALLPTALPTTKKAELPLRVLRPPLVGREAAWQRMDEAWQRRQLIFVSGVAGVGKSRLIQEFLASKDSKCGWFAGRLSDIHVPYATLTRSFRQVLSEFPVTPEPWVQRELARVLPELGEAPEAMKSESDLLRFCEAQNNVLRLAQQAGMQAVVYEDAHHIDTASLEAFLHFGENHWMKSDGLNMIVSFRPDEIRPDEAFADKTIRELVAADLAVLIELQPLTDVEVNQLVTGLGIADLEGLAKQLSQYTGGNPFFIIETVKHLIEEDKLAQGTPAKLSLPASGKVFALLKERLSRLSTEAQRLVWTAAIAETEFSIDLASSILAKSPFDLAEPFTELGNASIFSGVRFSHDLIFETALLTIPAPIKVYLHRRCAEELEKTKVNPAVVAEHWLSSGDEERAVSKLLEAAESQFQLGLLSNAITTLERASEVKSSLKDRTTTLLAVRCMMANQIERAEQLARSALNSPDTVAQITAIKVLSEISTEQGRFEEALTLVEQGINLSKNHDKDKLIAFQGQAGDIAYYQGDFQKAVGIFEEIRSQLSKDIEKADYLTITMSLIVLYENVGNKEKSKLFENEAYQLATELNSGLHLVQLASNYLFDCITEDKPELGIERAEAALGLGEFLVSERLRVNLGIAYQKLNRLDDAVVTWNKLKNSENETYQGIALGNLFILHQNFGTEKNTLDLLEKAFAIAEKNDNNSLNATVLCALLIDNTEKSRRRANLIFPKVNLSTLASYRRSELEKLMQEFNGAKQHV